MKRIAIICHDRAVSGANFSLLDYLEIYDRNKYQILVVLPHLGTELCSKLEALNVNFAVLNLFSVTKPIGKVNIKIRLKKILQRIINSKTKCKTCVSYKRIYGAGSSDNTL